MKSHADPDPKCFLLGPERQILLAPGAYTTLTPTVESGMRFVKPKTSSAQLRWSAVATVLPPGPGAVGLWCAVLDCPAPRLAEWESSLSSQERGRALRFRSEELRSRFIVSRTVLRQILGGCLGVQPAAVRFDTHATGKPRLANNGRIEFNLAHSADLMVLAVTLGVPVGVDVEQLRPMNNALAISRRFFTNREADWLGQMSTAERDRAFFQAWTRKEAILKATGEGITGGLGTIELLDSDNRFKHEVTCRQPAHHRARNVGHSSPPVSTSDRPSLSGFEASNRARFQPPSTDARGTASSDGEAAGGGEEVWRLTDLTPAAGFVGALALPREAGRFHLQTASFQPT